MHHPAAWRYDLDREREEDASELPQPPLWGTQQAEPAGDVTEEISEYYHGTYVSLLPNIIEHGFRPTTGAAATT